MGQYLSCPLFSLTVSLLYSTTEKVIINLIIFIDISVYLFLLQDAETIDRLNESGELRQILKPYKVSLSNSSLFIYNYNYLLDFSFDLIIN